MTDVAIRIENLSKRYRYGSVAQPTDNLRADIAAWVKGLFRRNNKQHPTLHEVHEKHLDESPEYFWALKDVNLEIKQGEVVGIIGRNGAGKSTLLKILSRITPPTTGSITYRGRVASLLEVGTGFHRELTGRENIFLNGSILGMTRQDITRKFDEIVAFSGVEKFIDTPVKFYSSGMYVRLAFAVAAHLEPEILVVDEVLAVGDAQFQKKCLGKMQDVARGGRTVLFVSHNLGAISQLCPRAIWLEGGKVTKQGATPEVVPAYVMSCDPSGGAGEVSFPEDVRKEGQVRRVRLLDSNGRQSQRFDCDHDVVVEISLQIRRPIPGLYGYLEITSMDGTRVMISDSLDTKPNPLDNLAVGTHVVTVRVPARTLAPGTYNVYLSFAGSAADRFLVDSPGIVCRFTLDDLTSRRGNTRPGYFSTLLNWQVT